MADSRRRARARGKSNSIDAIAVARATLREGLDALPAGQLEGPELDLRLLVDHRERLVRQRVALNNTLQWHLHDIWPELRLRGSSLFTATRPVRRPAAHARRADDGACASPLTSCAVCASSPDDQGARSRDRTGRRHGRGAAALLARLGTAGEQRSRLRAPSRVIRVIEFARVCVPRKASPGNAPRARHTRLGGPTTLRNWELLEACDHARVRGKGQSASLSCSTPSRRRSA